MKEKTKHYVRLTLKMITIFSLLLFIILGGIYGVLHTFGYNYEPLLTISSYSITTMLTISLGFFIFDRKFKEDIKEIANINNSETVLRDVKSKGGCSSCKKKHG